MTDDGQNITDLLAKIQEQATKITELENTINSNTAKITDYENTIKDRDTQISKLQKIVSDNLIASRDNTDNDGTTVKSFEDNYAEMLKKNYEMNKQK